MLPAYSRFEVGLDRGAYDAVYRRPGQCLGLGVWREPLPAAGIDASLRYHHAFYAVFGQMLDELHAMHGRYLVLDVHSYNHRRYGAGTPPTPQADALLRACAIERTRETPAQLPGQFDNRALATM